MTAPSTPEQSNPLQQEANSALTTDEQESILRLQHAVLEAVARGVEAKDIVNQLCLLEERLIPNSVASVMLLDEAGELLNVFAAPSVPAEGIARLNGLRPGPGGGSCGNAVFRCEPQFVHNTFCDPRWENLRQLAYDFNLCSCWSMPIFSAHGKVIGSFALSSFEHRAPTPFHRRLLEIGTSIAGIVLERRKAKESLRLYEMAFANCQEGMMITDAKRKILSVNPAFTKVMGYTEHEVVGQFPTMLSSGRHDQDFYARMWATLTAKGHWQGEIWNKRKNGEIFPEWLSISSVRDDSGSVTHYVGVFSDISEQKKIEDELRGHRERLEELVEVRTRELSIAKQAAEAASLSKSAFLANMSHEIRTPLTAILGLTHLVRRSGVAQAQSEHLTKVEAAGQHLLEVINAILDLSKIEAGKFGLDTMAVNLEVIANNVAAILKTQANEKGLNFHTEVDSCPDALFGDPSRLQQALLNLANNAVKFTDSGDVTIRIRVEAEAPDHALVRFEVTDTGCGVAPEQLDKLFTAFEQGDGSTTRKHGGTGLGLAITRKLAQLMQGDSGARSQRGQGSTFWFTARLLREAEHAHVALDTCIGDPAAELKRHYGGTRILLVEDEPINSEIVTTILEEEADLVVDHAADGLMALDMAACSSYSLILMDMQMPHMDGLEATRRLRQMPGHATTPILALTANAFSEDRIKCAEAGMDDFISKPIVPEALFAAILNGLRHRKAN